MNCSEFRERIFDDPRPAGHVCDACADWLRVIERQERVLSAARAPSAPDDLWSRIEGQVRPAIGFRAPRIGWFAAAAAILVAVVGFALLSGPPGPVKTLEVTVVEAPKDTADALRTVVPTYDDVDTGTAMADAFRPEGRRK